MSTFYQTARRVRYSPVQVNGELLGDEFLGGKDADKLATVAAYGSAGAAVGTAIPVIGNVVGGVIGTGIGATKVYGKKWGKEIKGLFRHKKKRKKSQNKSVQEKQVDNAIDMNAVVDQVRSDEQKKGILPILAGAGALLLLL